MRTYFSLTGIGLIIAALCGAALTWDGSAYLFQVLDTHTPFVSHNRYISVPLHWPVLLAVNFSTSLPLLQTLFNLIYVSIPLVALALSWWMVSDRARGLFIWPALAIGLAMLPGQLFFVAEANIAIQLFWPILLAVLTGMPQSRIPAVVVLSLAVFLSHPFAIVLFALAGAVAVLIGWRDPAAQRKMWLWAGVFAVVALLSGVQFWLSTDGYEAGQLSLATLSYSFRSSVVGLPLAAVACVWLAALATALRPAATPGVPPGAGRALGLAGVVLAGALLLIWARSPQLWHGALDFRYWTLASSLPFLALATFEGLRYSPALLQSEPGLWGQRAQLAQVAAAAFTLVLTVQSVTWFGLSARLRDTMAQSAWACQSTAPMEWVQRTPLDHWSVSTRSLLLQGSAPEKLVLADDGCAEGISAGALRLNSWLVRSWDHGWFDLRQLRHRLIGEQDYADGCSYMLTTGWHRTETDGPYWWRWSDGRGAQVRVLAEHGGRAAIGGQIETLQAPNQVEVLVNGNWQARIDLDKPGLQEINPVPVDLSSGKNTILFVSHNPAVETQGRPLAISVANLTLALDDMSAVCRHHP